MTKLYNSLFKNSVDYGRGNDFPTDGGGGKGFLTDGGGVGRHYGGRRKDPGEHDVKLQFQFASFTVTYHKTNKTCKL